MALANNIYESLLDELIYLRKGEGFSPTKLRTAPTLLQILGGDDQSHDDLRVRFTSAINSLPDKHQSETLLMAYGIPPEYTGIRQLVNRRKFYGLIIGLKPDAIAKHENAAIAELAIQLLTARYVFSPLPFSEKVVPHNAALHEYVEITTVVKDKRWQETREYYKIIPLVDDVGWLEISSDIPAEVTLGENALNVSGSHRAIRITTDPSSSGLRHRFYFEKSVMRGQLIELAFVMTPDAKLIDPNKPFLHEETRAFHEPTLAAKFEVIFIAEKPGIIWQYDHLAFFERPGEPEYGQILNLGNCNSVQASFTDLYGGMYSGVAWRW